MARSVVYRLYLASRVQTFEESRARSNTREINRLFVFLKFHFGNTFLGWFSLSTRDFDIQIIDLQLFYLIAKKKSNDEDRLNIWESLARLGIESTLNRYFFVLSCASLRSTSIETVIKCWNTDWHTERAHQLITSEFNWKAIAINEKPDEAGNFIHGHT